MCSRGGGAAAQLRKKKGFMLTFYRETTQKVLPFAVLPHPLLDC